MKYVNRKNNLTIHGTDIDNTVGYELDRYPICLFLTIVSSKATLKFSHLLIV